MSIEAAAEDPPGLTGDAVFDVIAISAIGAKDIRKVWRLPPTVKDGKDKFIWPEDTCGIFFFNYDLYELPEVTGEYGVTEWARKLLEALRRCKTIQGRDLHFAAHSTGGLVLKRALVIAMDESLRESSGNSTTDAQCFNTYTSIIGHCRSIAFFGTPHYGSTPLSDGACAGNIARILDLSRPYGSRLRSQLRHIENLDWMIEFSRQFAPLTLRMLRIWSFYETKETPVRVKIRPGEALNMTEATYWTQASSTIRSATIADENYYVGCEEVIPLHGTHAGLPNFRKGEDKDLLDNYISSLEEVMKNAQFEDRGYEMLARTIHVECHQFYKFKDEASKQSVKLFSTAPNPTLLQFFQRGPEYFVELRRTKANAPVSEVSDGVDSQLCRAGDEDLHFRRSDTGRPSSLGTTAACGDSLVECGTQEQPQPTVGHTTEESSQAESVEEFPSSSSDFEDELCTSPRKGNTKGLLDYYKVPKRGDYTFRWIHVPTNVMYWAEKILRTIERELTDSSWQDVLENVGSGIEKEVAAMGEESFYEAEHSDDSSLINDILENPFSNPASATLAAGAREVAKETNTAPYSVLSEALNEPPRIVQLLEKDQESSEQQHPALADLGPLVNDTRERVSMVTAVQNLPATASPKTTWMALNEAIIRDRKQRKTSSITSALLHRDHWNGKQNKVGHGLPHGRHMAPSFQVFTPRGFPLNLVNAEPGPNRMLQAYLYFPYLNWDTLGAAQARNRLFKSLRDTTRCSRCRDEIFDAGSDEKKIIWQYTSDPTDMPLHPRRTLDQYGYPELEDTKDRDSDQVIFRWARDVHVKKLLARKRREEPNEHHHLTDILALGQNGPVKESRPCDTPSEKPPSQIQPSSEVTNNFKILVVDQLWSWIVDDNNIVTFFPRKDDAVHSAHYEQYVCNGGSMHEERCTNTADLYDAIYLDVNGDKIIQFQRDTQCNDCLDFMASAVKHAVTLFLDTGQHDKPIAKDLRVLRIFRESVCDIIEECTKAFSNLKQTQDLVSTAIREDKDEHLVRKLEGVIKKLGNSHDLECLINVRDIKDELGILSQLFQQQTKVIATMIEIYGKIDLQSWNKTNHSRAIGWLNDAQSKVQQYQKELDEMKEDCKELCDSYRKLLDMKQKETSVVEAACARVAGDMATKQNNAILTFTVVTILFLPLSFFTSLFGMNVREWSGTDKLPNFRYVWEISGPISAGVIVIALLTAFRTYVSDFFRRHFAASRNGA